MTKYVFAFEEGDGKNKKLLGGKGANLCEMTQIGLNVPPGFVISTEACLAYLASPDRSLPAGLMDDVRSHIRMIEEKTGRRFGGAHDPLLVSVRSGSALSMPGMMDTILNLGLNVQTLKGLIGASGDERFAWDAYRRFIQLFGKVALGVPDEAFDRELEEVKRKAGVKADIGLSARDLHETSDRFLGVVESAPGRSFPDDPFEQLELAIKAVFNSWMGKRAVDYRREFNITPDQANGTAVNIVAMVFGNLDDTSATGVAFTRYPDTGENKLFGEYLVKAQGEDVVAGTRTPKPIDELANEMPDLFRQLVDLRNRLESHYKEVQDFEFTIEKGRLYCLQTRNGKMNAMSLVRTSVEMVGEGLIDKRQALLRIKPDVLDQMLFPRIDASKSASPVAQGLAASPGAATGIAIFDADRAEKAGRDGAAVILVREETKPEDIHGFFASKGILTSRGGKTSHAAVVARGMGKPCVAGAEGIEVDVRARTARIGDHVIVEGDAISIDGTSGDVYLGEVAMLPPTFSKELSTLLGWADDASRLQVFMNADTPPDARRGLEYGAKGIGLVRTERMFNDPERLPYVVEMIVADTKEARQAALDKLLVMQRGDFRALFETMAPRPVTVRLLDPPMHEFLPAERQLEDDIAQLGRLRDTVSGLTVLGSALAMMQHDRSAANQVPTLADQGAIGEAIARKDAMLRKVRVLYEVNPMLGHRGVRLGLTLPEIYRMQIRAILEAAAECQKAGIDANPEIMVPQVCSASELAAVKREVDAMRGEIEARVGLKLKFKFGSMLEVVRGCLVAEELANHAEFFSFGTNDLTQAVFSFSREDAENKFLPAYQRLGILPANPFEALDRSGVGRLMRLAVQDSRARHPDLKIGICGEHGGHPESIRLCHEIGLSYVSCSPPRVPIARLAAAHAALEGKPVAMLGA